MHKLTAKYQNILMANIVNSTARKTLNGKITKALNELLCFSICIQSVSDFSPTL